MKKNTRKEIYRAIVVAFVFVVISFIVSYIGLFGLTVETMAGHYYLDTVSIFFALLGQYMLGPKHPISFIFYFISLVLFIGFAVHSQTLSAVIFGIYSIYIYYVTWKAWENDKSKKEKSEVRQDIVEGIKRAIFYVIAVIGVAYIEVVETMTMETLPKYHYFDLMSASIALMAQSLLKGKHTLTFIFFIVSLGFNILYGLSLGSSSIVIFSMYNIGINIKDWMQWKKDEELAFVGM